MADFHSRHRALMGVSGTPGTGSITLGSAVPGFQTFAAAGVAKGAAHLGRRSRAAASSPSPAGPALRTRPLPRPPVQIRRANQSAVARLAVKPGDAIPIRLINPTTP